MIRVVVDAFGGDYAPGEVVKGAYLASQVLQDIEIILVGEETAIRECLIRQKCAGFNPQVIHAPETIRMDEPAALSIRKKRHSSIVVGLNLLKEQKGDAFVSCGNTGAVVSGAVLGLRLLKGVERPGIAIVFPTKLGNALMIDVGANIDAKPVHLLQHAIMAKVYSQGVLGKANPSVGILNIGEEESKGTDFLKEARMLFEKAPIRFIGNIEGKDVFRGACDCIICDGFIGNIALKISEGFAEMTKHFLLKFLTEDILGKIGLFLAQGAFRKFKNQIDYSEYGGAPLLGVAGVVIIAHGRSDAKAVKNAIRVAAEEVKQNVNEQIEREVNALH